MNDDDCQASTTLLHQLANATYSMYVISYLVMIGSGFGPTHKKNWIQERESESIK